VQTVDFFTPIVDDPYTYGQIAAANSLSDVYAMGARPLTALAIAGFPKKGLDKEVIGQVFRGGYDKLVEAGVALLGGHTVQDPEIKFGYAVTGAIDPKRILSNSGAKAGDRLLLTKPIGTGVIGTAMKNGRAPDAVSALAIASMRTLNKVAAETIDKLPGINSCTDITGFGLIGHGSEVANASGVTLAIDVARVPLFDGVRPLVRRNRNAGMDSNRGYFGSGVKLPEGLDADLLDLLYDPQTSGGLLIFVAEEHAAKALQALQSAGVPAVEIGQALQPTGNWIELR
jgi:selenide, water dikinase